MTAASTRELTTVQLALVPGNGRRPLLRVALLALLVTIAAAGGLRLLADAAADAGERSRLRQESSGMRVATARLQAELDLERATRAALEDQVAGLQRKITELEQQLAFVNAQRGRARAAVQERTQEERR